MKTVKREEEHVQEYLVSLGLGTVVYEPEKNAPPDFLIDGTIAVEVRRLNQNEVTDTGELRGLEETWIPFNMRFRRLLASLGPPHAGASWFVGYRLQRPLPAWRELRPILLDCLTRFRDNPSTQPLVVPIAKTLEIDFFPASKVHSTLFLWSGGADGDSGGFVVHEILKNLRLCVEKKTLVVAPHRHKYPKWWLVFVDLIGWVLDDLDKRQLRQHWNMEHDWDKIILISPQNPLSAFEIG